MISENRKYFAISIKHTEYKWKFGKPCVLWGYKQTNDDEPRCFAGYTENPLIAERYALGDFKKKGYTGIVKDDEPVSLSVDFCKKWHKYDSVLVDIEQYYIYCVMIGLKFEEGDKQ